MLLPPAVRPALALLLAKIMALSDGLANEVLLRGEAEDVLSRQQEYEYGALESHGDEGAGRGAQPLEFLVDLAAAGSRGRTRAVGDGTGLGFVESKQDEGSRHRAMPGYECGPTPTPMPLSTRDSAWLAAASLSSFAESCSRGAGHAAGRG